MAFRKKSFAELRKRNRADLYHEFIREKETPKEEPSKEKISSLVAARMTEPQKVPRRGGNQKTVEEQGSECTDCCTSENKKKGRALKRKKKGLEKRNRIQKPPKKGGGDA